MVEGRVLAQDAAEDEVAERRERQRGASAPASGSGQQERGGHRLEHGQRGGAGEEAAESDRQGVEQLEHPHGLDQPSRQPCRAGQVLDHDVRQEDGAGEDADGGERGGRGLPDVAVEEGRPAESA